MFYSPPRLRWSFVFAQPALRDRHGDVMVDGYYPRFDILTVEWFAIGLVAGVVFCNLKNGKSDSN
jgi:hypothetical protein